ncbi:hypothetical protein CRENBAI_006237 [Crenichthys baileyi]|uniref:Uncharacterized protein n=1 Tax=Crenichthys baileyi TaxID=28760 RepID=A0AAV9QY88_9TELE
MSQALNDEHLPQAEPPPASRPTASTTHAQTLVCSIQHRNRFLAPGSDFAQRGSVCQYPPSVCWTGKEGEDSVNSGVIFKLHEFYRRVRRGVEGEEEWGENTPLGGASADGSCAGEDAPQPHLLLPVLQEASDPLSGGGRDFELDELLVEDVLADSIEGRAEVHKQDHGVHPWVVKVLQDEV